MDEGLDQFLRQYGALDCGMSPGVAVMERREVVAGGGHTLSHRNLGQKTHRGELCGKSLVEPALVGTFWRHGEALRCHR